MVGVNMGFLNVVLVIMEVGDEIIFNMLYYFNYEMVVRIVGC